MARKKRKTVASRGFVNNIILECLVSGDRYGYDIIKEVEQKSDGKIKLKQPSLYSSLKRFETKGLISSYWGESDIGGRRHYYAITEAGIKYFNSIKNKNNAKLDFDEGDDDEFVENSSPTLSANGQNKNNFKTVDTEDEKESYKYELDDNSEDSLSETYINKFKNFNLEETINKLLSATPAQQKIKKEQTTTTASQVENKSIKKDVVKSEPLKEDLKQKTQTIEETASESYSNLNKPKEVKIAEFIKLVEETEELNSPNKNSSTAPLKDEGTLFDLIEKTKDKTQLIQEDLFTYKNKQFKFEEPKEIPEFLKPEKTQHGNDHEYKDDYDDGVYIKHSKSEQQSTFDFDNLKASKKDFENLTTNEKTDSKNIIYDNVGIRQETNDPLIKRTKTNDTTNIEYNQFLDLLSVSDEEKQKRYTKFSEKFETITKDIVHKKEKEEVDYKNILGELYSPEEIIKTKNAAPLYSAKNPLKIHNAEAEAVEKLEQSDEITDEQIKTAIDAQANIVSNNQLKEALQSAGFKFKPYKIETKHHSSLNETNNNFLLINKAKAFLGIILFVLTSLQVAAFYIILNTKNLIYKSDLAVYIIAIVLIVLTALTLVLPYMFNKEKRKLSTFSFGFALSFAFIAFITLSVFTYAFNALAGLNFLNLQQFLTALFLPIIMFSNIVLGVLIYKIIVNNKKFY